MSTRWKALLLAAHPKWDKIVAPAFSAWCFLTLPLAIKIYDLLRAPQKPLVDAPATWSVWVAWGACSVILWFFVERLLALFDRVDRLEQEVASLRPIQAANGGCQGSDRQDPGP